MNQKFKTLTLFTALISATGFAESLPIPKLTNSSTISNKGIGFLPTINYNLPTINGNNVNTPFKSNFDFNKNAYGYSLFNTSVCDTTSFQLVSYMNDVDYSPSYALSSLSASNSTAGAGLSRTIVENHHYQSLSGINAVSEAQAIINNEYIEYSITTSKHIALSQIGYYSMNAYNTNENTQYQYSLRVSTDNYTTNQSLHGGKAYDPDLGDLKFNINGGYYYLEPNKTYKFRVYFYSVNGGATATIGHDDFKLFGFEECDTDGDGLPDRIDLDDDNDGILDTLECTTITNFPVYHLFGSPTLQLYKQLNGLASTYICPTTNCEINDNSSYFQTTNITQSITNLAYDDGKFYVVDQSGNLLFTEDIVAGNFINKGNANIGTDFKNLAYDNGIFYHWKKETGTNKVFLYSSLNPVTYGWSSLGEVVGRPFSLSSNGYELKDIAVNNGEFLFMYYSTTITTANRTKVFSSKNPLSNNPAWIDLGNATFGSNVFNIAQGSEDTKVFCDYDNDGIPNHLDLDSDGDGCADAIEGTGGFTATQLTSASGDLATQTLNQNFGTTVDDNGVPTTVGASGQNVGASQMSTVIACLDSDGDGVIDICDLDDDNDGILDVNENNCNNSGVTQNVRIGYIPNTRNLNDDNGYTFDGSKMSNSGTMKLLNTSYFGPTGTVKANVTLVPITANPITKSAITSLNLNAIFIGGFDNHTLGTGTSYIADNELNAIKDWSDDSASNFVVVTQTHTKAWGSTITSGNINPNTPTDFGKATSVFNGPFGQVTSFNQGGDFQAYFATLNNFCATKSIAVDGNNRTVMYIDGIYNDLVISDVDILTTLGGVTTGNTITSNSDKLFANIWAFVISQSTCTDLDTDGDGIPNRLDLDSDDDGCPDAIEGTGGFTAADLTSASGSLSTQTINQNLGNNVDNNGIPVFTTPITGYTNGTGQSIGGSINKLYNDCKAFVCDEVMYLTQGNDTLLYTTNTSDLQNLNFVQNGTSNNIRYNATGFNPINGKLYAIIDNTNQVIMINNDGTYVNLGAVNGLPNNLNYNSGEIDDQGNYYVIAGGSPTTLYKINLNPGYNTTTLTAIPRTLSPSFIGVADIAYNVDNGLLYAVLNSTGALMSINPTTGAVITIGGAGVGAPFGGLIGADGELYGFSNAGGFYSFNIKTGARTKLSNSPASNSNDAAHCVTSPIVSFHCYKPAVTDSNTYPTLHGISALGRATNETDNWPMVRQSGWTALESKTTGFAINRLKFNNNNLPVDQDGLTRVILNPIEGMVVYDTTNQCLKMYTSVDQGTTYAWHCVTTPACPD